MRRLAAHYVWYKDVLFLHYIELADDGTLAGVFPLTEELAGTAFYDGILIPVPADFRPLPFALPEEWRMFSGEVSVGSRVAVYRLSGLSAAAAKLGTSDSGSHCHIERL